MGWFLELYKARQSADCRNIVAMQSIRQCKCQIHSVFWQQEPILRKCTVRRRQASSACRKTRPPLASYNKQGDESLRVDGKVTRLWKVFFKPGSGYTDRLGVAIPVGDTLDEVGRLSSSPAQRLSQGLFA